MALNELVHELEQLFFDLTRILVEHYCVHDVFEFVLRLLVLYLDYTLLLSFLVNWCWHYFEVQTVTSNASFNAPRQVFELRELIFCMICNSTLFR